MKLPLTLVCAALLGLCAQAQEAPRLEETSGWTIGGSATIDFCTRQLTYGLIDNDDPIITPSVELSIGNDDWFTLALSVDAIFDTTRWGAKDGGYNDRRWKYQELTPGITLSRTWDTADWLGSALDTAINYTYEYHPRACNKPAQDWSNPDTQWLNLEVALPDLWLQPTLTVEYQLTRQGPADEDTGKGGIYATLSVAHDFDIGTACGLDEGTLTLTPGLGFGIANRDRNQADLESDDSLMMRDGFATLSLTYAPIEGLEIAPTIGCHYQLDSAGREAAGDDDFVAYAGLALTYSF